MDADAFIELVATRFPDLRDELEFYHGLGTLQVAALCRRTQQAITSGDFTVVEACFALADRAFKFGDPALNNAIHVSYLEHLSFRGSHGAEAFSLLTPVLLKGWYDINRYMEQLLKNRSGWQWKGPPGRSKG